MTGTSIDLEARFARFVEHHVLHGERLPIADLCADRPDLAPALEALVAQYLTLNAALDAEADADAERRAPAAALPQIAGFETIERIGTGGMGDVYKLRDVRLDRIVAGKVIRGAPGGWPSTVDGFLREARALALFSDWRIVQIFEARVDEQPPVIIMEFVDGFELGRTAASLDFDHRARILIDVCEAVHHAHGLGLQHRDLKPSNIMLDAQLRPRILDFGLAAGDASRGHLAGTPPYMAPEQRDPSRPIDARADVHALGVILYELLAGSPPGATPPRLPHEIDPTVPEPLQAIALAAMEQDPDRRYPSAIEMARDLRRYLERRPVLARPSVYGTTLAQRVRPHVSEIGEWLRLRLIHPHEADRLRGAYRALEAPDDEWIVESRALTFTQIALYLGAFLLLAGGIFYFVAARWFERVDGIARPFVVLALPFAGLNAAAHLLHRREHRAVAVAFYLAAIALLPLFLLIVFHEAGWLLAPSDSDSQLFAGGAVSNRQLQVTALVACAWSGWLALCTRTSALSTVFAALALVFTIAVVGDFGLRAAIEEGRWDVVALRLAPLVIVYAALGYSAERASRPWFSRPLYLAGAGLLVLVMELLALDGRLFHHLGGFSLAPWEPAGVTHPGLLDAVAAMTINGALFYGAGALLARHGTEQSRPAAQLLYVIAPFALLHPLGYLVRTGEYALRLDWMYAASALAVMLLSERRQRRSFYYAGLLNLAIALFLIASHREWFDRPAWAVSLILAGLAALAAGFMLDRRARAERSTPGHPAA